MSLCHPPAAGGTLHKSHDGFDASGARFAAGSEASGGATLPQRGEGGLEPWGRVRRWVGSRPLGRAITRAFICALVVLIELVLRPIADVQAAPASAPRHGIAMHGAPALPRDFTHLPYANPNAPQGGRLTLGQQGTFDSLNPFLPRGVAPPGIRGYVYESLMARSEAEPFSLYGLLAASIEMPDDRSAITFNLRPSARFSDGKPVTAEDVAFSHRILKAHAVPFMRSHYAKATKVEVLGPHKIRFTFGGGGDREIPLILGLMPILPRHAISEATFKQTSLTAPIGSGPYTIAQIDPGRSITYRKNPNYWGKDLPLRRGYFNFSEIRYDYYRDAAALFSAFKTGRVDLRVEEDPARWSSSYTFSAVKRGDVVREALPTQLPAGMTGIVFNTRRPHLQDQRVRQALIALFDFRWINQLLFDGLYVRSASYFARSPLAAVGSPATANEKALLAPFPEAVRPKVLEGTWRPPSSAGDGRDRSALRKAHELLRSAGYEIRNGRMVRAGDGVPLTLNFLARTKTEERLMLAYATTLKRLGIGLSIRQVDDAQYWARLKTFDYDLIHWRYPASLSPGNEQINRWASTHADIEGSLNFAGARSKAADALIVAMLGARERKDFEDAVRAFDRVLISQDYVIPLFHPPAVWVAYWSRLKRPKVLPLSGFAIETWWVQPGK